MVKTLNLTVTTPESLEQALHSMPEIEKIKSRLVVLSISEPQVLVRQFELPKLTLRELHNSLRLEAVELLNLGPNEIEIDYQITGSQDDKIKGVFAAAPRKLLKQYLSAATGAGLIPIAMTANILTVLNAVLSEAEAQTESFYLLDFAAKNTIDVAMFYHGNCELVRKISYETMEEAKQEGLQSLRYACGKSSCKQPDKVYFTGDLSNKDELIMELGKEINCEAQNLGPKDTLVDLSKNYFNVNLIKGYTFPLPLRNKISLALNLAIVISLVITAAMAAKIKKTDSLIKNLKKASDSTIKKADLDHIKVLQEKINALKNEK